MFTFTTTTCLWYFLKTYRMSTVDEKQDPPTVDQIRFNTFLWMNLNMRSHGRKKFVFTSVEVTHFSMMMIVNGVFKLFDTMQLKQLKSKLHKMTYTHVYNKTMESLPWEPMSVSD